MEKITNAFGPLLGEIKNSELKEAIVNFLLTVPENFWTIPASSSGKYHPSFSLGNGGLVRHTVKAIEIAKSLSKLKCYELIDFDIVYAALFIHDTFKQSLGNGKYYNRNHAMTAANQWLSFACNKTHLDQEVINEVFECVLWHMGQWSEQKIIDTYSKPSSFFESVNIVHICDYISSRKEILE